MEIRKKGEKGKVEVEYTGMSLRHEHVANDTLPKINIFFKSGTQERAEQIAYGAEEEGLPRCGIESEDPFADALEDTMKKGLGVAIGVDGQKAQIFCRQFKKSEPFMSYEGIENEALRVVGKNASRILKHKPFILED